MKYLLSIRFLGSAYQGYQVQKNGPSVQAELTRAAKELFGYPCDIVGCSRTDSGVHAEMFSATVSKKGQPDLPTAIPPERVPLALNAHLPEDISVYRATPVPDNFHARYDVKSKEYRYFIYDDPVRNPFLEGRAFQFRAHLTDEAIDRMNRAAGNFVGKHDFRDFRKLGAELLGNVGHGIEAAGHFLPQPLPDLHGAEAGFTQLRGHPGFQFGQGQVEDVAHEGAYPTALRA